MNFLVGQPYKYFKYRFTKTNYARKEFAEERSSVFTSCWQTYEKWLKIYSLSWVFIIQVLMNCLTTIVWKSGISFKYYIAKLPSFCTVLYDNIFIIKKIPIFKDIWSYFQFNYYNFCLNFSIYTSCTHFSNFHGMNVIGMFSATLILIYEVIKVFFYLFHILIIISFSQLKTYQFFVET